MPRGAPSCPVCNAAGIGLSARIDVRWGAPLAGVRNGPEELTRRSYPKGCHREITSSTMAAPITLPYVRADGRPSHGSRSATMAPDRRKWFIGAADLCVRSIISSIRNSVRRTASDESCFCKGHSQYSCIVSNIHDQMPHIAYLVVEQNIASCCRADSSKSLGFAPVPTGLRVARAAPKRRLAD
jgi:hypothetical protein